ncbi:hypothetical protein ABIA39_008962 [Nocardia sp. GAS34]
MTRPMNSPAARGHVMYTGASKFPLAQARLVAHLLAC